MHRTSLVRSVASAVRAEAARAGMSYPAIAPHLDLKPGQVGRKMRGQVQFTIDELGILADLFGIEVREFFQAPRQRHSRAVA